MRGLCVCVLCGSVYGGSGVLGGNGSGCVGLFSKCYFLIWTCATLFHSASMLLFCVALYWFKTHFNYLRWTAKAMFSSLLVCLFVCLFVCLWTTSRKKRAKDFHEMRPGTTFRDFAVNPLNLGLVFQFLWSEIFSNVLEKTGERIFRKLSWNVKLDTRNDYIDCFTPA